MINMLEHKGYFGTVEYSAEDNLLYGKVVGINGLISYDGESLSSLKECFIEAIDDYLICCDAEGREPMKPYCGKLDGVSISPELHKDFALFSSKKNKPMPEALEEAMRNYIAV
jgi:predicted HicB family RNase H-like nuclease